MSETATWAVQTENCMTTARKMIKIVFSYVGIFNNNYFSENIRSPEQPFQWITKTKPKRSQSIYDSQN